MGKIVYGNENFGYAPIVNNQGVYSFGTPAMLEGMVSSSAELEETTNNVRADNKVWCVVTGAKTRSLEAVFRYITNAYASYLGYKEQANGMLVDTGEKPNHCVFFESLERDCETGEETRTLHYFYNVKAKTPNIETQTTEDTIDPAELGIEYTSLESDFVVDADGKKAGYGYITRTETNKNLYDSFKTAVILPTSTIPQA